MRCRVQVLDPAILFHFDFNMYGGQLLLSHAPSLIKGIPSREDGEKTEMYGHANLPYLNL